MASFPDPSSFAISVAVGTSHILNSVIGALERASMRNPVFDRVIAVLIAVPVLMAYLAVVALAFAIRVAADAYAHMVADGGDAAMSLANVLGWFASMTVKLAVALVRRRGPRRVIYSSEEPYAPQLRRDEIGSFVLFR
ncbi:hypothetical protein ACP70R_042470 [Stipagrostis hirtigluma subsp. patula]